MACIYAYTPPQTDADMVPFINVSEDPGQETVVTVRQKGGAQYAAMSLPCDAALAMGLALVQHFAPEALALPQPAA